jgi:hypothetical protein
MLAKGVFCSKMDMKETWKVKCESLIQVLPGELMRVLLENEFQLWHRDPSTFIFEMKTTRRRH